MEHDSKLRVVTVSGACCMPHLARLDRMLAGNLKEACSQLGLTIEVHHASLSAILAGQGGLTAAEHRQIMTLFETRGATFAPAVLIGEMVRFAGKPPSADQLKAALQAALEPSA